MSNIINKSNHPIEVKRINLRIWKLRDEIEAAIEQRLKEHNESGEEASSVQIDDIKDFYLKFLNSTTSEKTENAEEGEGSSEDSNLDSSGNPLDDDAMAMMEALGGGAEQPEAEQPEIGDPESNPDEETPAPEDDAAAAMAAEMLGDQGGATEEDGEVTGDDAAADLAAQMLADQGSSSESPNNKVATEKIKPFKRIAPNESKISKGYCLLSDIQMDQIMVFSKDTFIVGQNVIIEFLIPNSFSQITQVIGTTNIARKSSIISETKPGYRLQCHFLFKFPAERATLRDFLKSVEPEIPAPPKKLKRPDDDDEDDDFDDLGF